MKSIAIEPVVAPGQTAATMTDRICAIALRERAFLWWWLMLAPSAALLATGIASVALSVLRRRRHLGH